MQCPRWSRIMSASAGSLKPNAPLAPVGRHLSANLECTLAVY